MKTKVKVKIKGGPNILKKINKMMNIGPSQSALAKFNNKTNNNKTTKFNGKNF